MFPGVEVTQPVCGRRRDGSLASLSLGCARADGQVQFLLLGPGPGSTRAEMVPPWDQLAAAGSLPVAARVTRVLAVQRRR